MTTGERLAIGQTNAVRWRDGIAEEVADLIAVEEPLEIRLAGVPVVVTMRTPGDDLDLAAGFLYTERVIRSPADIASIAQCETDDARAAGNVINVNPTNSLLVDPASWGRTFAANSACGVCGKAGIDQIRVDVGSITCPTPAGQSLTPAGRSLTPAGRSSFRLAASVLVALPDSLRERQSAFDRTGGVHAAGLFDVTGELIVAREDVGRHNAVDKVIGAMVRQNAVPHQDCVLVVSSRASFEIVQKALVAGIPIVATVSAPSSLAIELARDTGMTLIGFLRGDRFNVYSGFERIRTTVTSADAFPARSPGLPLARNHV